MWQIGEHQTQMFMMGLHPSLRRYLVSLRFHSVQEEADTVIAQKIETDMFQKSKEGNSKAGQSGDKGKRKRSFSGPGGPQQQSKGSQQ